MFACFYFVGCCLLFLCRCCCWLVSTFIYPLIHSGAAGLFPVTLPSHICDLTSSHGPGAFIMVPYAHIYLMCCVRPRRRPPIARNGRRFCRMRATGAASASPAGFLAAGAGDGAGAGAARPSSAGGSCTSSSSSASCGIGGGPRQGVAYNII